MARGTPDKYTAIIEAAVAVVARRGYDQARMADIARAAGVAAGTTYLYFKSKQDLLVTVFREKLGRMQREMEPAVAQAVDPREQLRRFVQVHFNALADEPDFAALTQIEVRQSNPEIRRETSQVMEAVYFTGLERMIQAGQSRGLFRRDVDFRLIRNMIFGTLDQTVTAWVLSGYKWDLRAQAEPAYGLLISAICGAASPSVAAPAAESH